MKIETPRPFKCYIMGSRGSSCQLISVPRTRLDSGTRLGTKGSLPWFTGCQRRHFETSGAPRGPVCFSSVTSAAEVLSCLRFSFPALLAIARLSARPETPQLPPGFSPRPPNRRWVSYDSPKTECERRRGPSFGRSCAIWKGFVSDSVLGLMNWSAEIDPSSLPWLWIEWTCRSYGWHPNLVVVVGGWLCRFSSSTDKQDLGVGLEFYSARGIASERVIERVQFWVEDEFLDFWILDAADASLQLESECGARRFVPFPSPLLWHFCTAALDLGSNLWKSCKKRKR